jgi:hypothetical protein
LWAGSTAPGRTVAESTWLFAIIESFHLVGLAILGGAVAVVDFRLLGLVLTGEPTSKIAAGAERWVWVGLVLAVTSGLLLYASEATKFYSPGFWDSAEAPFIYKMLFLILALVFTFTVRRALLLDSQCSSARARIVAVFSLLLWLGVATGGRAIGFY